MFQIEKILKDKFGFEEKYDFTWIKDNYICARWMCGDKIFVYQKIEGGVWKLSYFLPCKIGNSVEEIQQYSDICDEMIRKIQRQRKLERIINE